MNKSKENYVKPAIDILSIEPLSICAGTNVNIGIGGLDDGKGGPAAKENKNFVGDDDSLWKTDDTEE